jgi:magnesium transporter
VRGAVLVKLTGLLGRNVLAGGVRLGRIADLSVPMTEPYPPVARLLVGGRHFPWAAVRDVGEEAVELGADAHELSPELDGELLLKRDVLDCQIYDFAGKRLTRVGDVELALEGRTLRVIAVDVGASAILRRLGLRVLARRVPPQALDWEAVHLASTRGHALQLDKPAAAVHRLSAEEVAHLVSRLPATRGKELLETMDPVKAAPTNATRAERHPARRRFRKVLAARKRAPA